MSTLVVVGSSLAGLRAVEAARRAKFDGNIVLIGAEKHLAYDRPALSKASLVGTAPVEHLQSVDALRSELHIDVRLETTATGLQPETRTVQTSTGEVAYDSLIIASGAAPRIPSGIPALDGIVTLRTIEDSAQLRTRLRPGAHVVILGAGFIGAEVASSSRLLGAMPTIIDAAPVPLVRAVGAEIGRALASLHGRHGTPLHLATRVEEYLGRDRVEAVRLTTGEVLPADVVVVGVGAAPATGWLLGSGISLHPDDQGIVCDEFLRTSLPGVFAAGDVAHWPNAGLDATMRLENWTNAADQGVRAGTNAVTPQAMAPYRTVPYFWSDWYGQRIQFVGTAATEDVEFVSGAPQEDRFVAAVWQGDRLVGAATLNEPRKVMKLRRLIAQRGSRHHVRDLLTPVPQP
ncbi:NAD(P)/FAD-dependent oxidoreductase [Amycolatopsis pithecellobii]|uniref:FAD-dependent oxidoreductase n=1 Tax=Amycolatopsis pithecellobii TaxID=664692 RepID=A0A6N7Z571_9PSEU|nr:FAD-dependent oxidoreductase [Amycolatopsis pithecellobii]MTD55610.1 FAD-dependent oxidoreductase [Amycolatopsis pithecellobii]